ncbi:hypothetical protein ACJX0J_016720, partial [Zea mays]
FGFIKGKFILDSVRKKGWSHFGGDCLPMVLLRVMVIKKMDIGSNKYHLVNWDNGAWGVEFEVNEYWLNVKEKYTSPYLRNLININSDKKLCQIGYKPNYCCDKMLVGPICV